MASITVTVGMPQGDRTMAFTSERNAAVAVEVILRKIPVTALPTPIWIRCDDREVAYRLADYLSEVQAELVRG